MIPLWGLYGGTYLEFKGLKVRVAVKSDPPETVIDQLSYLQLEDFCTQIEDMGFGVPQQKARLEKAMDDAAQMLVELAGKESQDLYKSIEAAMEQGSTVLSWYDPNSNGDLMFTQRANTAARVIEYFLKLADYAKPFVFYAPGPFVSPNFKSTTATNIVMGVTFSPATIGAENPEDTMHVDGLPLKTVFAPTSLQLAVRSFENKKAEFKQMIKEFIEENYAPIGQRFTLMPKNPNPIWEEEGMEVWFDEVDDYAARIHGNMYPTDTGMVFVELYAPYQVYSKRPSQPDSAATAVINYSYIYTPGGGQDVQFVSISAPTFTETQINGFTGTFIEDQPQDNSLVEDALADLAAMDLTGISAESKAGAEWMRDSWPTLRDEYLATHGGSKSYTESYAAQLRFYMDNFEEAGAAKKNIMASGMILVNRGTSSASTYAIVTPDFPNDEVDTGKSPATNQITKDELWTLIHEAAALTELTYDQIYKFECYAGGNYTKTEYYKFLPPFVNDEGVLKFDKDEIWEYLNSGSFLTVYGGGCVPVDENGTIIGDPVSLLNVYATGFQLVARIRTMEYYIY